MTQFKPRVDRERLAQLWAERMPVRQIGEELGCTGAHVCNLARELGLPRRIKGNVRRELPGVGAMIEKGMSLREIADHFDCSESTVGRHVEFLGLRKPRETPAPALQRAQKTDPDKTTLAGRLIATKGRYAALAELAAQNGWTSRQALQRYHQAARAGA